MIRDKDAINHYLRAKNWTVYATIFWNFVFSHSSGWKKKNACVSVNVLRPPKPRTAQYSFQVLSPPCHYSNPNRISLKSFLSIFFSFFGPTGFLTRGNRFNPSSSVITHIFGIEENFRQLQFHKTARWFIQLSNCRFIKFFLYLFDIFFSLETNGFPIIWRSSCYRKTFLRISNRFWDLNEKIYDIKEKTRWWILLHFC